jgi:hypothetical protein
MYSRQMVVLMLSSSEEWTAAQLVPQVHFESLDGQSSNLTVPLARVPLLLFFLFPPSPFLAERLRAIRRSVASHALRPAATDSAKRLRVSLTTALRRVSFSLVLLLAAYVLPILLYLFLCGEGCQRDDSSQCDASNSRYSTLQS